MCRRTLLLAAVFLLTGSLPAFRLDTAAAQPTAAPDDDRVAFNRALLLIVASHSPHVQWPENDGYDPVTVDVPPYLVDTHETRVYRTMYYTDVTLMDERLGAVLDALDRHGYTGPCWRRCGGS